MALIVGNYVYDGYSQGAGDLNWGGGYAILLGPWVQDNVAANQTNVLLGLPGGSDGYVARSSRVMVRGGSVLGIVVRSNEARTAGTLTVEAMINGVGIGLTAVLDGTNTIVKSTTQNKDVDVFIAGDRIGAKLTTDAGWAPTTADITVEVLVEQ